MFAARVTCAAGESPSAARSAPSALSYAARFLPQKSSCQDKVPVNSASVSQLPAYGGGNRPCSENRPRTTWLLKSALGARALSAAATCARAERVRASAMRRLGLPERASLIRSLSWLSPYTVHHWALGHAAASMGVPLRDWCVCRPLAGTNAASGRS